MKAVEDSNGVDAWRCLNKALKPTSKARGLALLGAATTWPACSMSSALQPQLLKLEEVFDGTVKAGTTVQEELKSAILVRCVGGQLKSHLNLTVGDNVQYSALREQVWQWDRSQQKWATPMAASSSTDYPMDIDRVQAAKRKDKNGENFHQKGKGKDAKGKGRKGKEIRKEQKVIRRAKVKAKTRKVKAWCGNMLHLWKEDCWRNNIQQVASDPAHSSSGHQRLLTQLVNNMRTLASRVAQQRPSQWSGELRTVRANHL